MDSNALEVKPVANDSEIKLARSVIGAVADYGAPWLDVDCPSLAALPESFRGAGGEFFIISMNGSAVGTVGILPCSESEWQISFLTLVAAWRGMGIGRLAVEKAIHFARDNGAIRILAKVDKNAASAIGLFTSLKFKSSDNGETLILTRIYPAS